MPQNGKHGVKIVIIYFPLNSSQKPSNTRGESLKWSTRLEAVFSGWLEEKQLCELNEYEISKATNID